MRRSRRSRSPRARSRWPIATAIAAKASISATPRTARSCGRRRRSRGARPNRPAAACCCIRASRRSSSIPRGAAASPSWRRRSGPARSITRTSRRCTTMRARTSRRGRARCASARSSARCAPPGLRGSRLRESARAVAQHVGPRRAASRVEGFTPPEISGHDFRMAVGRVAGWQSIKSTAFDVDRTSSGYRFKGRGFGHGVGLCVIGAGRRAATGATADRDSEVLLSRA